MAFEINSKMAVKRDENGKVTQISHPTEPYYGPGATRDVAFPATAAAAGQGTHPRTLAESYLREVLPAFGVNERMSAGASEQLSEERRVAEDDGQHLRTAEEKIQDESATISYAQTTMGLPVWQKGFSVRMRGSPMAVVGSTSTLEEEIGEITPPAATSEFFPSQVDGDVLKGLLSLEETPEINGQKLLVYQYRAEERGNVTLRGGGDEQMAEACPQLDLPEVPDRFVDGRYYIVGEIMFRYTAPGWGPLNWRAFIEPETGAVLRADALVSCVGGTVLVRDPLTANGTNTLPTAPIAQLDALREIVELQGVLHDGSVHRLEGPFVRVENVSPPHTLPPTVAVGNDFEASVTTDEFAAINGYYHCDQCFRLVEDLGFDVQTYFGGTAFPVTVDHRATIGGQQNTVNASAPGNANGNGSDGFRFALLAPNATIGMAVEQRVTWHEFGHALLWDHLNSPNFRFAHSPGDAIAAIMLDPDSSAPDRGRTFPWTIIGRRHDHQPNSGFAFGGAEDDPIPVGTNPFAPDRAGYQREQILSSTLYRLYRSAGGGSSDSTTRRNAALRTVWLLLETIRSLSPVAQPGTAEDLFNLMVEADLFSMSPVVPRASGLMHKVVRWAFEQQGLFQPSGASGLVTEPGAPPEVDLYIDDSRAGGYAEVPEEIIDPPGLVVRLNDDGGSLTEDPEEGAPCFIKLSVTNRGSEVASGVTINLAARQREYGEAWDAGWEVITSENGTAGPSEIGPGETAIFGPVEWTPNTAGKWTLFADVDCPDDRSLVRSTFTGECNATTLAMLDNNAATRLLAVVPATG